MRVKFCFLQFLVDILPLGSGFVDAHTVVEPDPLSQNLADPTDPDPTHCNKGKGERGKEKKRKVEKGRIEAI